MLIVNLFMRTGFFVFLFTVAHSSVTNNDYYYLYVSLSVTNLDVECIIHIYCVVCSYFKIIIIIYFFYFHFYANLRFLLCQTTFKYVFSFSLLALGTVEDVRT